MANELLKKVGSVVHRVWMSIFGATKGATVGKLDWREVGSAVIVAIVFYAVSGNLQDVLKDIDPNGTAVTNLMSMLTAFIVSLLHKGATGTQTKDGSTYIPEDHAK